MQSESPLTQLAASHTLLHYDRRFSFQERIFAVLLCERNGDRDEDQLINTRERAIHAVR